MCCPELLELFLFAIIQHLLTLSILPIPINPITPAKLILLNPLPTFPLNLPLLKHKQTELILLLILRVPVTEGTELLIKL